MFILTTKQRLMESFILDALIDARAIPKPKDFHITKIHGKVSLVEVKGLSSQKQTVNQRADLINPDIEKAAASLVEKYIGSTVLAEKRKYGKDGKYLALVTGSLGNVSADVTTFIEFIAGVQTLVLCSGAIPAGSSFSACIATIWYHLLAC
jgi:hypothetical protein